MSFAVIVSGSIDIALIYEIMKFFAANSAFAGIIYIMLLIAYFSTELIIRGMDVFILIMIDFIIIAERINAIIAPVRPSHR